jgi:predicted kinase
VTRLILLNGPPGVGKSTVASRYAAEHPGTLRCDIDVLRTMIGGWEDDYPGAGALIRPAALGLIAAYLRDSGDVVLPQLIARATELGRFERAAGDAGAGFVHVLLLAEPETCHARFEARGTDEPHLSAARQTVDEAGGAEVVAGYRQALVELAAFRPATVQVDASGAVDATYIAVLAEIELRTTGTDAASDR